MDSKNDLTVSFEMPFSSGGLSHDDAGSSAVVFMVDTFAPYHSEIPQIPPPVPFPLSTRTVGYHIQKAIEPLSRFAKSGNDIDLPEGH